MPSWVTHLAIADIVLKSIPNILKHEFCVGNIAPDCNIENEDWTSFTPSREVTHFMHFKGRKTFADCDKFLNEYIKGEKGISIRELSFLLGYYSHLVADVEYQEFVRESERLNSAWNRILKYPDLSEKAINMVPTWENVKHLISAEERGKDFSTLERKYLDEHPNSGFTSEILTLDTFPDYIDFLPQGGIVRKVKVMGCIPQKNESKYPFAAISEDEYNDFIVNTAMNITDLIEKNCREELQILVG